MRTLLVAATFFLAAVTAHRVGTPKPADVVRRDATYMELSEYDLGAERIRRAQVDPKRLRIARSGLDEASVAHARQRRTNPSPLPSTCPYSGPQPGTEPCKNQDTSDGCTSPSYYQVYPLYLQLLNGHLLQANGHVNIQYIPLSQYRGIGSKRSPDPHWQPISAGLHFDPNNNQPGGAFIGDDWLPWGAITTLPTEGYCIIWVQVSNFNSHFGEGGQGPVCYCPTSSRKLRV